LAPILRNGRLSIKANEMTDYLWGVHDQVKKAIEDSNAMYKAHSNSHRRKVTFEVGDLVWVVLTRDHILVDEYNKLRERKIGPCDILRKINDNAYRLRLSSHLKTSNVFNIKHLTPCFVMLTETTWTQGRVLSNLRLMQEKIDFRVDLFYACVF
jgi:hypothetical protein